MIVINHHKYGGRAEFSTLNEAEEAIRACGPEFSGVWFRYGGARGNEIWDNEGDRVGAYQLFLRPEDGEEG